MIKAIGHRGVAGLEPENTLRSFRAAMQLGVDTVECDVRLTRDGHAVLMHDHAVDRTTDGAGPVSAFSLDEIRSLDAGSGERVPTLVEFLGLIRGRVEAHVELKDEQAAGTVLDLVRGHGVAGQVFLTSGNTGLLAAVRVANSEIRTEHIFADPPEDAVQRATSVGARRISSHIRSLTRPFVEEAHSQALEVIAWPPNSECEMAAAAELGVDLMCSDRPDILMTFLRTHGLR